MRLGRRLSAGIAEDPPAPAVADTPERIKTPEPVAAAPAPVVERSPDPVGNGG